MLSSSLVSLSCVALFYSASRGLWRCRNHLVRDERRAHQAHVDRALCDCSSAPKERELSGLELSAVWAGDSHEEDAVALAAREAHPGDATLVDAGETFVPRVRVHGDLLGIGRIYQDVADEQA